MANQLIEAENHVKKGELIPAIEALSDFLNTKKKDAFIKKYLLI